MLIEFCSYLKFLWEHSVREATVGEYADMGITQRNFTLNQLELPSKAFNSDAASPICFKLAKDLGVSAAQLANRFVANGNATFGPRCEFFIGGGGYLNGKFQQKTHTEFLERFRHIDISQFLSGISITADEIFGTERHPFCELRLPVKECSLDLLLESGDPDVDPGIGYMSWYAERFRNDCARLQNIIDASVPCVEASREWLDQPLFLPMFKSIWQFRYAFLSKLTTGRPELAVVECRNMINGFYSVFNHPSVRNMNSLKLRESGLRSFKEFSRSYGELVDKGLQLASGAISR